MTWCKSSSPFGAETLGAQAQSLAIMTVTKGPLDVVSEPDRPARETDAEDEIEITDEMVAAGVSAFLDGDLRFETEASIVRTIFREMIVRSPYFPSNIDSFRNERDAT